MAEIIEFEGETFLAEPPVKTLDKAKAWGMDRCLIIGFDENNELQFGGSFCDSGEMLLLLELAKHYVMKGLIP